MKEICADIEMRYEIEFLEIGTDEDDVHILVQSVPKYSPTKIVRTIKSITAKKIFKEMPEVKLPRSAKTSAAIAGILFVVE